MSALKGFKFVTTLILEFKKKQSADETIHSIFYLNSNTETVINESDIDDLFETIYSTSISNIKKFPGQGSG